MTTAEKAVTVREEPSLTPFEVIERVITAGDLQTMKPEERVAFYWRTCESLGLNPLTRPFEFINLNGKLTMYARKDATDQLRRLNQVSVTSIRREKDADLDLLTVYAAGRDKSGREDEATGVVNIAGLRGEALANAVMKAETKAKRRLTLSLVGLGFLDESEVENRGDLDVDPATGEISERPKPKTLLEQVQAQQDALAQPTVTEATEEEPVEAEVREEPAGLTQEQFLGRLKEHQIDPQYAAEVAKAKWPDTGRSKPLTPAQRVELLVDLTADDQATAGL